MKIKYLKYLLLATIAFGAISCETYSDQEVENSAIYPMSGEWLTHVYDESGSPFGYTEANKAGTLFALRTYNTTANESNKAWIRLGSTQDVALLGKIDVDLIQKIFSGQNVGNDAKPGKTFTILEGKVLLASQPLPSGANADSIYIRYSTTVDNKTYVVKGHRRTQWTDTE